MQKTQWLSGVNVGVARNRLFRREARLDQNDVSPLEARLRVIEAIKCLQDLREEQEILLRENQVWPPIAGL